MLLLVVIGANFTRSCLKKNDFSDVKKNRKPIWLGLITTVLLLSPLWLGLLYLVPIPTEHWRSLAGRNFYYSALQSMQMPMSDTFSLSLMPDATWASALAGVPVVAVFLAAMVLPLKNLKPLLMLLLMVATVQVIFSVLQLALGQDSYFYFDIKHATAIIGSFANRNHLANFLVMCLPICAFILYDHSKSSRSRNSRSSQESHTQIRQVFLVFVSFSFLLILLSTQSRGGLISGFIALSLSTCIYLLTLRNKVSRMRRFMYFAIAIAFVGFAMLATGIEGIQSRLGERLLTDAEARNMISQAALLAASNFWPWGSGLGSFEAVFPRFQPALNLGQGSYIEYAHNDYAQIIMELGVFGIILMAIFAVLLLVQIYKFTRIYMNEGKLPNSIAMQCFCGVSLIAFLLHCWVEFNMHIPALAMTAAFLAGVFLRKPTLDKYR